MISSVDINLNPNVVGLIPVVGKAPVHPFREFRKVQNCGKQKGKKLLEHMQLCVFLICSRQMSVSSGISFERSRSFHQV